MADDASSTGGFEGLAGLVQAAEAMHNLQLSFVAAGFTEDQALLLVSNLLVAMVQQATS